MFKIAEFVYNFQNPRNFKTIVNDMYEEKSSVNLFVLLCFQAKKTIINDKESSCQRKCGLE